MSCKWDDILRKFHSANPERSRVVVDTLLWGPWAKVRAVGAPALFGCCWSPPGCPGAGGAGLVFGEAKQGGGSGSWQPGLAAELPCLRCLLLSQGRERDAQTVHPFPTQICMYVYILPLWINVRSHHSCQRNRGRHSKIMPSTLMVFVFSAFRSMPRSWLKLFQLRSEPAEWVSRNRIRAVGRRF